jgi:hypothetical protein
VPVIVPTFRIYLYKGGVRALTLIEYEQKLGPTPLSVYKCTSTAILNSGTFVCDKTCVRTDGRVLLIMLPFEVHLNGIYFEHKVCNNYIISEVVISLCFEELA